MNTSHGPLLSEEVLPLDVELTEPMISIHSNDNCTFCFPKSTVCMSEFVKNTLLTDRDATQLSLNVKGSTLELIFEYMMYHTTNGRSPLAIKPILKPIRSLDMKKIVDDPWDAEFSLKLEHKQVFDIIVASNYLQVEPLLNLLCARVATLIKNKSHDEIRKLFSPNEEIKNV